MAVYAENQLVKGGSPDRDLYVVNAAQEKGMAVMLDRAATAACFDVFGRAAGTCDCASGVSVIPVPASGYARIRAK